MANDRKLNSSKLDAQLDSEPEDMTEGRSVDRTNDDDLEELRASEARQRDLPPLAGVQILLVDDTPDMLHVASAILRRSGARVHTVGSAREARQILEDTHPDVIVSDLAMPEEDGFSFIESLRALEKQGARHIPAIALTAFSGPEFRLLSLRAGFEEHLLKPILAETLVTAIQGVLKIRRSIH